MYLKIHMQKINQPDVDYKLSTANFNRIEAKNAFARLKSKLEYTASTMESEGLPAFSHNAMGLV